MDSGITGSELDKLKSEAFEKLFLKKMDESIFTSNKESFRDFVVLKNKVVGGKK